MKMTRRMDPCFSHLFLESRYVKGEPFFNGRYTKGILSLSRSVGRVGENPGNEVGPY